MSNVVLYGRTFDFSADPAPQQKVNAAQLVTQLDFVFANCVAIKAALDVFLRDDNSPQDAIIPLRSLKQEILTLLQSAEGWQPKPAVDCATTAPLALTGEQTIDGVVTLTSRVLVKDQAAPAQNGIYVTAAGVWTRAADAAAAASGATGLPLAYAVVKGGTLNKNSAWVIAQTAITTVGVDALTWTQVYGTPAGTASGVLAGLFPSPTFSALDGGALQAGRNLVVNGDGRVAQRPDYVAAVSGTYAYGKCDRWAGALVGTAVGGTLTQDVAAPGGQTGFALRWSTVTTTGAGTASFRQRIEAKDAVRLKNRNATLGFALRHDAGVAITGNVFIRKANATDNFAAVTQIATAAFNAATATNVPVTLTAAMGDCSNGIEIEVVLTIGAVVAKNFWLTDIQLELGSNATPCEVETFGQQLRRCRRRFRKSFPAATAPAQNAGATGALVYTALIAAVTTHGIWVPFDEPMAAAPAVTLYNPSAANAKWRNFTATLDSAVGAALFVAEGGFYLQNPQVGGDALGAQLQIHYSADCEL